jgi:hypothetical protein
MTVSQNKINLKVLVMLAMCFLQEKYWISINYLLPHSYMDYGCKELHRVKFLLLEKLPVPQMMKELSIITETRLSQILPTR